MPDIAGTAAGLLVVLLTSVMPVPASGQQDDLETVLRGITADRLRAHLTFLSDDLLEGRAPGTRGARIAGRYIAAHFERAGLRRPGFGWYQPVPLIGWKPRPDSMELQFEARGRHIPVSYPTDAVLWTAVGSRAVAVDGEVVFAGYGVRAPEEGWDDYGDADVRGKVLLLLAGDPPSPPDNPEVFDGAALTWYGRWTYKLDEAARRGAAAALIIHSEAGAGYGWDVVRTSWTGEQVHPAPRDTSVLPPRALEGWIRPGAARFVLGAAGLDLEQLVARAGRRDFEPIATGLTVHARAAGSTRPIAGANLVGILPGGDPVLRDEAVVYTAHFDHLGIGPSESGDSIYNGAYDNASGVSVLLELATAFARLQSVPGRSIIFIATTAEETGQLGAQRYVMDPVIPMERTAAVINIDGANLWGPAWDIAAVGAERSTLGEVAEEAARREGLRLSPERAADKGFFFRSDHFPFVQAGVPALSIEHGLDYRDRPPGWGVSQLARFDTERYHRPSDEYDPAFDLAGAVQQARFSLLVGLAVARDREMPRYLDDSEFQRIRGHD